MVSVETSDACSCIADPSESEIVVYAVKKQGS